MMKGLNPTTGIWIEEIAKSYLHGVSSMREIDFWAIPVQFKRTRWDFKKMLVSLISPRSVNHPGCVKNQ